MKWKHETILWRLMDSEIKLKVIKLQNKNWQVKLTCSSLIISRLIVMLPNNAPWVFSMKSEMNSYTYPLFSFQLPNSFKADLNGLLQKALPNPRWNYDYWSPSNRVVLKVILPSDLSLGCQIQSGTCLNIYVSQSIHCICHFRSDIQIANHSIFIKFHCSNILLFLGVSKSKVFHPAAL